jgi:uncharacterized protein
MDRGNNNLCLSTLDQKRYILGHREATQHASLQIGRFYALDGSYGAMVEMDTSYPHAVLICGKRGYGKSYTLGVIIEELALLEKDIRDNLSIIVIDTLGIFWTSAYPNHIQEKEQNPLRKQPSGIDFSLFVPENALPDYTGLIDKVTPFHIRTSDLTADHWCMLFDVKPTDPFGMILTNAVLNLQSTHHSFTLSDILETIQANTSCDPLTKGVAENYIQMAESWNLFTAQGTLLESLIQPGRITILDISHLQETFVKDVLLSLISEYLFKFRVQARKEQEQKTMGLSHNDHTHPLVWLAIDEAHLFLPAAKNNLSKKILIEKWLRQGRQPGLSLIMATQRPSAIDEEVLSHCDLFFCHRLTSQDDILALQKLRPTYMKGSIEEIMKRIGKEKGVCLVIDDTMEEAHIIKIRPRISWHGGGEPHIG